MSALNLVFLDWRVLGTRLALDPQVGVVLALHRASIAQELVLCQAESDGIYAASCAPGGVALACRTASMPSPARLARSTSCSPISRHLPLDRALPTLEKLKHPNTITLEHPNTEQP